MAKSFETNTIYFRDLNGHGFRNYVVPPYQREYKWDRERWSVLFDDITENGEEYFMGTIICIVREESMRSIKVMEVIDGQQRMITLCVLLIALYHELLGVESAQYRKKLEKARVTIDSFFQTENEDYKSVLVPQKLNGNLDDFNYLLKDSGILDDINQEQPDNWRSRRIGLAYKFFTKQLEEELEPLNADERADYLINFHQKVNSVRLVEIDVGDASSAYQLFEAVNDRGLPLTPIDLIKNHMLSTMDRHLTKEEYISGKKAENLLKDYAAKWQLILNNLNDDASTAKRFLQQNYNAFRSEYNSWISGHENKNFVEYPLGATATASRLIPIYVKLIDAKPEKFLDNLLENSRLYAQLMISDQDEDKNGLNKSLKTLSRVRGIPSYSLLLFLLKNQKKYELSDDNLKSIVDLLVKYFLRRNLTDYPPTNTMIKRFQNIVKDIESQDSDNIDVFKIIRDELVSSSVDDDQFRKSMSGDIYLTNYDGLKFILSALAEKGMNKENYQNLWKTEGASSRPKWTIEHIFPEGENIPKDWVAMVGDGDYATAKEIQNKYVHKIGNLTLTAFNSNLGTKSFSQKKEYFRNGFSINEFILSSEKWTATEIQERSDDLIEKALKLFEL